MIVKVVVVLMMVNLSGNYFCDGHGSDIGDAGDDSGNGKAVVMVVYVGSGGSMIQLGIIQTCNNIYHDDLAALIHIQLSR